MAWIKCGERMLDGDAFMSRARRAAGALDRLGVQKGDGVALYMRNDVSYFEANFGVGMLGAYPVPVNWHYTADEANYLLRDSGVKVLVIHADLLPPIVSAVPDNITVVVVETPPEIAAAYGVGEPAPVDGALRWSDLLESASPLTREPEIAPNSIVYTSGTTGRPKGVKRPPATPERLAATHTMLAWSYGYADHLKGIRRPDEIVTAVVGPIYHAAPNAHSNFSIRIGANVLIEPRFDPERLLQLIEQERITHLNLVPIMFTRLLRLPDSTKRRYDLSSLEYVAHAAAPCPPDVKRAMIEWWGPVINEYYGSTEMGNVTNLSSEEWLKHPGSVGRVMPGSVVQILDDAGAPAPPGVVGEVIGGPITGADFTYVNAPEKRAEMDRGGLVAPGDIGFFDEDGFLFLCDRKNNMIISGGANIYPAEIEAELLRLPGVADCAVFGIPDDEFGERVMAVVQPELGAQLNVDELQLGLRRTLSGYKVPRQIEFVETLPREDSGKIFKRKLRDPYWAGRERKI